MTDRLDLLLWVALPYLALAIFVVGHVWRYRRGQLTWTSRSTQILERRLLQVGSLLFHFGILAVIGGHVLGILVPSGVTEAVGIDEDTCAVVGADRTISVLGRGAVTIVDGAHVSTDAYRGKGYRPVMVSGAVLHSLPSGYRFDMRARALLTGPDALEDGEAST